MSVANHVELCIPQTWSHKNSGSSPEHSTLKVEGFEDVEMSELKATQKLWKIVEAELDGLGGGGGLPEVAKTLEWVYSKEGNYFILRHSE
jgi:hypothetical protein